MVDFKGQHKTGKCTNNNLKMMLPFLLVSVSCMAEHCPAKHNPVVQDAIYHSACTANEFACRNRKMNRIHTMSSVNA